MSANLRAWLAVIGGCATSAAAILALTSPTAGADPIPFPPPGPAPVTVTQTVTVAPLSGAPAAAAPPASLGVPVALPPPAPAPAAVPAVTQPGVAPAPAVTPTITPAASGTIKEYLAGKHVTLEPQRAQGFSALNVTLPVPPGWTQVPDPNVPDAFAVIANRNSSDLYPPNAQVVVYKLAGGFDPNEAISHGFIDSQALAAWRTTDGSIGDFYGFPSSQIEGTYRQNQMTLNTSRRHVIATSGPDKYLVSLSVTSMANVQGAPSSADATNAIVTGFRVTAPSAPAPGGPAPLPVPFAPVPAAPAS